jgi:hypothetical protein
LSNNGDKSYPFGSPSFFFFFVSMLTSSKVLIALISGALAVYSAASISHYGVTIDSPSLYYAGDRPVYASKKLALNPAPDAFVNNAQLLTNVAPSYAPPGKHLLGATVIGIPELSDAEYDLLLRRLQELEDSNPVSRGLLLPASPISFFIVSVSARLRFPSVGSTLAANSTGSSPPSRRFSFIS